MFFLFCFLGNTNLYSQTATKGTLRGRIFGSDNKEPLPSAIVMVKGTSNGAAADVNGNYIIRNINAGKRIITVSYLGYETKNINVIIKSEETTELNVSLEISAIKGKEVVATAQRQGQIEAINKQITSNTIVNVVSSDRIKENPDANAAESIGRLPGISLTRSGGEGTGIIIRGLAPQYSTITLDGIQLPSTNLTNRTTNISGLSQYLLETVEVYKSVTPDMDGDAVAGTVNLTLAPAPEGSHINAIAQTGYNHLNDYLGNYVFNVSGSQRFFNDKFGIRLNLDAERVNRGRQTLGASYGINSNTTGGLGYEQVLLGNASLNNIGEIKTKQAATLVTDWKFSNNSKLIFYNFFSSTGDNYDSFSKNYNPGAAEVTYGANINNLGKNLLYTGILKGENAFGNLNLDYGASFSQAHSYTPLSMNFNFQLDNGYNPQYTTNQALTQTPGQIINESNDNNSVLNKIYMTGIGYTQNDLMQKDINAFLNAKEVYKLNDDLSGYLKGGVKYKSTTRNANAFTANQQIATNPQFVGYAIQALGWVSAYGTQPSASAFASGNVSNFINGEYNFGWNINYDRLSQLWYWWNNFSNRVIAGDSVNQTIGQYTKIGFVPDFYGSSINDQNITEKYYAGYLMGVLNYGDLITFIPGVRYEKVTDNLIGNLVYDMSVSYTEQFPRQYVTADRQSEFFLPNFHLTIRPTQWMHIQAAYTKTIGYPSFSQIMPNTYINNGFAPYIYNAGNPNLKPEQWSSYDLLVALFSNEVGLFSVDGYYKEVKNNIWTRTYTRIPGDPVLPGFGPNDEVTTSATLNNDKYVYVKGLEFEWQTNFWYLPSPFNYFSLDVNYSLINSEAQYPAQRLFTTYHNDSRGRPIPSLNRVDTTVTGRMLNQPDNIANVSLGFNYQGLNLWLSYQFNGSIITSWSDQPELIGTQGSYQRWDLQISQKLPIEGLVLRGDVSNINNVQQISKLIGDPRPTYLESYGWTSDIGIMYNF
jgi:TonB-dependent receptor